LSSLVIDIAGVAKRYGTVRAVDGVDLSIGAGELFGLIGHNGAGKTTLFKLMLGLLAPDAGRITIGGESVHGPRFRDVRRSIGFMPESVALYGNLTGAETMAFFARLKRAEARSCAALLERVGLADAAHRPVKQYSKGMQQRLLFAQALLGAPAILFLDEPTHGLDPAGVAQLYAILDELRSRGVTVVLTSHILAEVGQRVDRIALMVNGAVRAAGTVQALRDELDLPLGFDVRLAAGAERELRDALGTLARDVAIDGDRASFRCARRAKLDVLAAVAALGGRLVDVTIREPSLEDVFMAYGGAR
jgi:Cu-processing system ATP-binding protein